MTAEQAIKQQIMRNVSACTYTNFEYDPVNDIDSEWERLYDTDLDSLYEALSDFRYDYQYETGLPCPSCRHYECKAVATMLDNGQMVGYNYWFGGGKHGEPSEVEWLDGAYFLDSHIETREVRVFTKKGT